MVWDLEPADTKVLSENDVFCKKVKKWILIDEKFAGNRKNNQLFSELIIFACFGDFQNIFLERNC